MHNCICCHELCERNALFRKKNGRPFGGGGVGVVFFNMYYDMAALLLALELSGQYRRKMSITAGKCDPHDNGCLFKTLCREIHEEIGLKITVDELMTMSCNPFTGQITNLIINRTPVVICFVRPGFSSKPLKKELEYRHANPSQYHHSFREIGDLQWISLTGYVLKGQLISPYSCDILSDFVQKILEVLYSNQMKYIGIWNKKYH